MRLKKNVALIFNKNSVFLKNRRNSQNSEIFVKLFFWSKKIFKKQFFSSSAPGAPLRPVRRLQRLQRGCFFPLLKMKNELKKSGKKFVHQNRGPTKLKSGGRGSARTCIPNLSYGPPQDKVLALCIAIIHLLGFRL